MADGRETRPGEINQVRHTNFQVQTTLSTRNMNGSISASGGIDDHCEAFVDQRKRGYSTCLQTGELLGFSLSGQGYLLDRKSVV